jgi:hypothetical protein
MMRVNALSWAAFAAAVAIVWIEGAPARAAAPSSYQQVQHTIEGYWNVDDNARRAAIGGVSAALTPAGQEIQRRNQAEQAERTARGDVVGLNSYICGVNGVPNVYTTSEPWALVVSKGLVVQAAERTSLPPRYFYTDGRTWAGVASLPPSVNGYSIGRWEGADLVVETRRLPPGGVAGGGLKGPDTVLTERFGVSDDGSRLTVTLTFTDPELLARPHTYQVFYDRAAEHTYAYGAFCDPNEDPAATVEEPDQGEAPQ